MAEWANDAPLFNRAIFGDEPSSDFKIPQFRLDETTQNVFSNVAIDGESQLRESLENGLRLDFTEESKIDNKKQIGSPKFPEPKPETTLLENSLY